MAARPLGRFFRGGALVVALLVVVVTAPLAIVAGAFDQRTDRDAFGIRMLYPTRDGARSWTSAHWTGRQYVVAERVDGQDPQGISGKRGSGTLTVADGVLTMAGPQPRLYIQPYAGTAWRDVELTVYYRRVLDDGTAFAGMVADVRSGTNGHTPETPCEAHTYYARMRHDGAFDFAKELEHPSAAARARIDPAQAWPEPPLPRDRWIGFKYVAYNAGGSVKLEVYRDVTEGKDGGQWLKVNETTDAGDWPASTDCPAHNAVAGRSTLRVLDGGSVLIRNTGVTDARYRWVSLREIQAP